MTDTLHKNLNHKGDFIENPNEQMDARVANDLASINRQILMCARDVANNNLVQCQQQFGVSQSAAVALRDAGLDTINRLAQMPALIFQPRLPAELLKISVTAAAQDNDEALKILAAKISIS